VAANRSKVRSAAEVEAAMSTRAIVSVLCLTASLCACGGGREPVASSASPGTPPAAPTPPPAAPAAPTFEVHEWGLVRGGVNDAIIVGATVPTAMPMAVAKPVLYFHLSSDAPLEVHVVARMGEGGTIAESWPLAALPNARAAEWHARVRRGSCHHGRLPSLAEPPCSGRADGCEANTLDTVESDDADCVTVGEQAANHLFYRGTLEGVDPLPLVVERLAGGRLRVRNRSAESIPGVLLRVRLAHGVRGVTDAATATAPPPPGATVELEAPSGATAAAALAVATMSHDLGLTTGETAAFRRAWDTTLFGLGGAAAAPPIWPPFGGVHAAAEPHSRAPSPVTATPLDTGLIAQRATESLIYFLPPAAIERIATLQVTPRPTQVRRAIAVWLDLPAR